MNQSCTFVAYFRSFRATTDQKNEDFSGIRTWIVDKYADHLTPFEKQLYILGTLIGL